MECLSRPGINREFSPSKLLTMIIRDELVEDLENFSDLLNLLPEFQDKRSRQKNAMQFSSPLEIYLLYDNKKKHPSEKRIMELLLVFWIVLLRWNLLTLGEKWLRRNFMVQERVLVIGNIPCMCETLNFILDTHTHPAIPLSRYKHRMIHSTTPLKETPEVFKLFRQGAYSLSLRSLKN